MNKIKGCESHYKASVDDKIGDLGYDLKYLATELLDSLTKEAYNASYDKLLKFLDENKLEDLKTWVTWWHDQCQNIFCAFTGSESPRGNQEEVVHASFVNRSDVGISLMMSTEFDVRVYFLTLNLNSFLALQTTVLLEVLPLLKLMKERQRGQ